MKFKNIIFILCMNILFLLTLNFNFSYAQDKKFSMEKKLLNRIDFNSSYIMGQSIKSGAVYLLNRKKSEIESMLKLKKNYRDEILNNLSFPTIQSQDKNEKNMIDFQMEQYVKNF